MTDKWAKKISELEADFPGVSNIDWAKIVKAEPDVFRSVVGGAAKSPALKKDQTYNTGNKTFAQINGLDYSDLYFVDAFNVLWGERSISDMVNKTKLSKAIVYGLRRGTKEPTMQEMEQIAEAFHREPAYFMEYRVQKILAAIAQFLLGAPETAVVWYSKVEKSKGIIIS